MFVKPIVLQDVWKNHSLRTFFKRYGWILFLVLFVALSVFFATKAWAMEPKSKPKPKPIVVSVVQSRPEFKVQAASTTTTTTVAPQKVESKQTVVPQTVAPVLPPANNLSHNEIMAQAGIPEEYWSMVEYIIAGENADWNPCKYYGGHVDCNYQGSKAYGIPQSLPGSKMASAGADWRTNPVTQLRWMHSYVNRYGGWAGAVAHKKATGWY